MVAKSKFKYVFEPERMSNVKGGVWYQVDNATGRLTGVMYGKRPKRR